MSVDLSQFHAVFFEESFEGLDSMEAALLELQPGPAENETINVIFRAAHSIKGGAGAFGFTAAAQFTHILETLLDEIRDGKREVTRHAIDLLLKSVDCVRNILAGDRDGTDYDEAHVKEVQKALEELLGQAPDLDSSSNPENADSTGSRKWQINFAPDSEILQTGNDPLRMFRELAEFGALTTIANIDNLPDAAGYEAEQLYMRWQLELEGDVSETQIREVFDWVIDNCELEIIDLTDAEKVRQEKCTSDTSISNEVAATKQAAAKSETPKTRSNQDAGGSIRVSTDKIDELINKVGELVITQSMLGQFGEEFDLDQLSMLRDGLSQLERNTRELQESVMQIRMLPISFSFNRFPRLVHDLSQKLDKKIELRLSGEHTEVDKTVLEKITDPMVHLVRNSLDHGIEMPDIRKAAGKNETGIIELNAFHQGGNIVIEIKDDGAGLDPVKLRAKAVERGVISETDDLNEDQINNLIFAPGFSTAGEVSDISGRGVGMDVVRRNVKDLGGSVDIKSEFGAGCTMTIRLPLTLAILDGQLVRVGQETYIIPLVSIIESLQIKPSTIKGIAGETELYKLRDEYIPVIRLYNTFGVTPSSSTLTEGLLVVVEGDGEKAGLFVDDLLAQQQVVIKSLDVNFRQVQGVSGATILGDGTVAMIVDVQSLLTLARNTPPVHQSQVAA